MEWVALAYYIPSGASKNRVYIWRKLREYGAGSLRPGFAVLPDSGENRRRLRELSRNDMEHLDLVGQLIVLLGGDPIFGVIARQGVNWWRGGLIPRNQTARQALTYDIRAQEEAIRTYRRLMLLISDPNIDALLRRILADEQCQLQVLRSLLSTL